MPRTTTLLSIIACFAWAPFAQAATIQPPVGFDSGTTETWTAGRESALPSNVPDGGPTGVGDNFMLLTGRGGNGPGSIVAVFSDDPNWTGDLATPGIADVSVDLMSPTDSIELSIRLVLFGDSNTNNRWTSTEFASVPNDGVWRNYQFSVAEADLTRVRGSSTYDSMISDVVRIMLRNDTGTPSSAGSAAAGTLGIDNIGFRSACDPNTGGDLDGSGDVGFPDFLILSANFGSTATSHAAGDIDCSGEVGFPDFLILSSNFGKTVGGETATVPEPSGLTLAGITALLGLLRQRQRNSPNEDA